MKIQELRVGNYVTTTSAETYIGRVSEIKKSHYINKPEVEQTILVSMEGIISNWPLEMYEPIPLTEEWLEKFGFWGKYKSVHTHWTNGILHLDQKSDVDEEGNSIPVEQVFYFDFRELFNIKWVHQLQNLYFDLSGEELTIKEK